jgi:hypothetical protein
VSFQTFSLGSVTAKAGTTSSGVEDHTITDGIDPGKVVIYPHGYSVRIKVHLDKVAAESAFRRCGWSPSASDKVWKTYTPRGGNKRWVLRGSAWLTQRAPSNLGLPMAKANKAWRTRIYSLGLEECGTGYAVDLQGVRYRDIDRFMKDVLQVAVDNYEVDYYRKAERYLVLSPHDAHRVAEDLGGQSLAGRGRLTRKRFLLKDHEVPVTVRRQTQMKAMLTIYRIDRGATSQFKCEVSLAGKRRDRQQFGEADIETLDKILLGLVDDLDLAPTYKPARWEPRNFSATIEQDRFDPQTQKLGQKAWRGDPVTKRLREVVKKCHTPEAVVLLESRGQAGTYPPDTCIRTDQTTSSSGTPSQESLKGTCNNKRKRTWTREKGKGFGMSMWKDDSTNGNGNNVIPMRMPATWMKGGAWKAIAQEVGNLPGHLTEVILDGNQDPGPLIEAVCLHSGGKVGVSALCGTYDGGKTGDTWYSVNMAMLDHPVVDDINIWIIVVDVTTVQAIIHHINIIMNTMSPSWDPFRWGLFPWKAWVVGAWLWELIKELRDLCERENVKVVMISTDLRPQHGCGQLHKSHFYKDTRVRSWLGDAGRYLAHQRYRVEPGDGGWPGRVVAIKDEAEGLVGRLLFEKPGFTTP